MPADVAAQYLDEAHRQMRGHKRLAEGAMAQLKDEELFFKPDAESNSIAIIVKHMGGKYALALHRLPDHRRRET